MWKSHAKNGAAAQGKRVAAQNLASKTDKQREDMLERLKKKKIAEENNQQ